MRSSSDTAIVSRRQTRDKTINNGNEAVVRCRGVRIRFLWTRSRTNLKTNVHVQRAESSCCFTNINRTGIPRNVLFRQKTGGDMLSICLFVYLSGNGGWRRQQPAGRLVTHVCGSAAAWCYIFIRWTGWTFAVILSRQALLASFAALFFVLSLCRAARHTDRTFPLWCTSIGFSATLHFYCAVLCPCFGAKVPA